MAEQLLLFTKRSALRSETKRLLESTNIMLITLIPLPPCYFIQVFYSEVLSQKSSSCVVTFGLEIHL